MLSLGSRNSDVTRLQQALQAKGFSPQGADGAFGRNTRAAVVAFQRANRLQADGVVGRDTAAKLFGSRERKYFDGVSDFTPAPGTRPAPGARPGPTPGSASRLVNTVRQVEREMPGTGRCAAAVNEAVRRTYGVNMWGHANQVDNNLPRSHFREVNLSLEEALRRPGLVLTWERTNTRLGRVYGHTAITTGDGRTSVSDYSEADTLAASRRMGRQGLRVFEPIR
ncbi:MAG: peptidoglycan-binding protein [Myxococcaceae bacterium]|jgi:peptidoglycan hydrolase-like protein with peptidoglycan-binding domain|nr:peptidoglycan-binding protein [Myxococcaceae bacterium]MCA3012389.1 peptidoglycan-binding protein [Myxococcaceae bacterium]